MPRHVQLVVFLGVVALALSGCGGTERTARIPISGKVLIDGKPVEHGTIQVVPQGDRAAFGKLGPGGTFQLTTYDPNDGCVPGTHGVAIIATESQGPGGQKWHAPKKYMSPATSGLTLEVKEPTDAVVIELTWDGGQPFVEKSQGD